MLLQSSLIYIWIEGWKLNWQTWRNLAFHLLLRFILYFTHALHLELFNKFSSPNFPEELKDVLANNMWKLSSHTKDEFIDN